MIPIVFFDGAPDKVGAIRKKFPAAHYTAWESLPDVLGRIAAGGSK
jgi:hypothetical protein